MAKYEKEKYIYKNNGLYLDLIRPHCHFQRATVIGQISRSLYLQCTESLWLLCCFLKRKRIIILLRSDYECLVGKAVGNMFYRYQ